MTSIQPLRRVLRPVRENDPRAGAVHGVAESAEVEVGLIVGGVLSGSDLSQASFATPTDRTPHPACPGR